MPKRTSNYRDSLMRDLLDPAEAATYLNAAIDDPEEETLLLALRDVAEAHQLARVANEAGIARESIYRTLSATGNPRTTTLRSIVRVLGLRFHFEADSKIPELHNEDPTETANRLAQFNKRHALNSSNPEVATIDSHPNFSAREQEYTCVRKPPQHGAFNSFYSQGNEELIGKSAAR
jgi:probable addiction module antidote protein